MDALADTPRRLAHADWEVSYFERGEGPALVLLHGIGSGARSWRLQLDGLAAHARVVAWDAPGYGESRALEAREPDAGDYAARLVQFVDRLGINAMHLVGHSLGGIVAARLAADHPGCVLSLTLASPSAGHARKPAAERISLREGRLDDLRALGPRGMAEKRGPRLLSPDASEAQRRAVIETMARVHPEGYEQAVYLLSGSDTRADVARLAASMPVQFVFGDADVVTTPASILEIASERAEAPVHRIAGAGHAVYLERPGEFNALLVAFLASADRAG